jgi:hypothetical protein
MAAGFRDQLVADLRHANHGMSGAKATFHVLEALIQAITVVGAAAGMWGVPAVVPPLQQLGEQQDQQLGQQQPQVGIIPQVQQPVLAPPLIMHGEGGGAMLAPPPLVGQGVLGQQVVPLFEANIPMYDHGKNEVQFTKQVGGFGGGQRYHLANNQAHPLIVFFRAVSTRSEMWTHSSRLASSGSTESLSSYLT